MIFLVQLHDSAAYLVPAFIAGVPVNRNSVAAQIVGALNVDDYCEAALYRLAADIAGHLFKQSHFSPHGSLVGSKQVFHFSLLRSIS